MEIANRNFYEDCGLENMPFCKIKEIIKPLTKREQDVLVKYYDNGMSLENIGKSYGLTRERIRQIKEKAIKKIKKGKTLYFGYVKMNALKVENSLPMVVTCDGENLLHIDFWKSHIEVQRIYMTPKQLKGLMEGADKILKMCYTDESEVENEQ